MAFNVNLINAKQVLRYDFFLNNSSNAHVH